MSDDLGSATLELIAGTAGLTAGLLTGQRSTEEAMVGMGAAALKFGAVLGGVFAVAEVVKFGEESVKAAMQFQASMELIHTQAGASQAAVDSMSQSVLKMAASVGTAPETLSEGLFHLVSQGLSGAQAMDALKVAAEGAKVGQANLEDVTNALGAAVVSHIKGVQDLSGAMGTLNAIVGAGDMHMQDLADSMSHGLDVAAKIAGVSLTDLGGALATFGDNNIRGADAGTLLTSTIRLMSAPSGAAQKALEGIGISANQLGEDLRKPDGLVVATQDLKDHLQASGDTATEQAAVLSAAFGGKQSAGIKILVDELDRLKTKTQEVGDGANQFGADWQATTQTAQFNSDQFHAALDTLKIELGDKLLPAVTDVTKALTDAVTWLGNGESMSDRLRDAMDKLGVSASTQKTVMHDLSVASSDAWAEIQRAAQSVVTWYQTSLAPAISNVVQAAEAIWREFGGTLTNVAQTALTALTRITLDILNAVKSMVQLVSDLIAGRWGQAWSDLKSVVSNAFDAVWTYVSSQVSIALTLGLKVGSEIVKGLEAGLHALEGVLTSFGADLGAAIESVAKAAYTEALQIGADLINGVVDGIESNIHKGTSAIEHAGSALGSAFKSITGIGSPSKMFAEFGDNLMEGLALGVDRSSKTAVASMTKAMADARTAITAAQPEIEQASNILGAKATQGIIDGIFGVQQSVADQLKAALQAAVQQAMQAAAQEVQQAKATFSSAFSSLASSALQAFQTAVSGYKSPAQILLDKDQLQDQILQYNAAVTSGAKAVAADRAAINAAAAAGDQTAQQAAEAQLITDQASYHAAQRSLVEFNLSLTAQEQTAAHTAEINEQSTHLANLLNQIKTSLPDQVAEYVKSHADTLNEGVKFHATTFLAEDGQFAALLKQAKDALAQHPGLWSSTYQQILNEIVALEGPMEDAGKTIGAAFTKGVGEGLGAGNIIAGDLAGALSAMAAGAVSNQNAWANIPQAATGGYVAQSGLAVIHQGETVLTAGAGGGLTGDITLLMDSQVVARITRAELVRIGRNNSGGGGAIFG